MTLPVCLHQNQLKLLPWWGPPPLPFWTMSHSFVFLKCHPWGKTSEKSVSFGQRPKGEGDSTGIRKFWGSSAFPYFDQLLDITRGERGEGGFDHVLKVLMHFLLKYWKFGALEKLPHCCPKWANTKVTSQCPIYNMINPLFLENF